MQDSPHLDRSDRGRVMNAKYILAALSIVFLILGTGRVVRHGVTHPQGRVWLLIGAIFAGVSGWLFQRP